MWKLVAIYAPLLGATLISGALTIDEFHNWYDVLAGAIIGTTMAFSAYRMVYASIWDFRFNHVPLVRTVPFTYSNGASGFDGFHDSMWTRQAGWGHHERVGWGGAPFDISEDYRTAGGMHGSNGTEMAARRSGEGRPRQNSIPRRPVPASPRRGDHMV